MMYTIYSTLKKINKYFRRKFYTYIVRKTAANAGNGLTVNGKSRVTPTSFLGNNVNFNNMLITGGGKVTIGDNFHSGIECQMITGYHNFDHGESIPYDSTYINKDIYIDDNVWLGNRVIILGGVHIGEGAIIQAGSVVVSDIQKYGIAGGHPAKVFSYRDKEHYEKLKSEKKFH